MYALRVAFLASSRFVEKDPLRPADAEVEFDLAVGLVDCRLSSILSLRRSPSASFVDTLTSRSIWSKNYASPEKPPRLGQRAFAEA